MRTNEELEADVDRLETALRHLTEACMVMNQGLAELAAHTDEHHEVINDLGRIVTTLEALMIGGDDETPVA